MHPSNAANDNAGSNPRRRSIVRNSSGVICTSYSAKAAPKAFASVSNEIWASDLISMIYKGSHKLDSSVDVEKNVSFIQ
jgi:hypothetical protein